MKAMGIIAVAVCLASMSGMAKADPLEDGVQIQVFPELGAVSIEPAYIYYEHPDTFIDEKKLQTKYGLYSFGSLTNAEAQSDGSLITKPAPKKKKFALGGKEIAITLNPVIYNGDPNGRCGLAFGGTLTLTVNGKTVLDQCPLATSDCSLSEEDTKEELARSECANGVYYDANEDVLFNRNNVNGGVRFNATKVGKK